MNEFKKYIKTCVLNSFTKIEEDKLDAIGASDFLPDRIEDDKEPKLQKNDLSTRIKKIFGKSIEPMKKKTKAVELAEIDSNTDEESGSGPGDGKGPKPGPGPHPGPGQGPFPGADSGPNPKSDKPGDDKKYKEIDVKKRLVCTDIHKGKYTLSFISPSKSSKGKLVFNLAGEQSDFELPIYSANIISSFPGTCIERITGNTIYLNYMNKGDRVKIEVIVDFDSYCMMEVDYYANKK